MPYLTIAKGRNEFETVATLFLSTVKFWAGACLGYFFHALFTGHTTTLSLVSCRLKWGKGHLGVAAEVKCLLKVNTSGTQFAVD